MSTEMDDFLGGGGGAAAVDPPAADPPAADAGGVGDGGKPPSPGNDAAPDPTPPADPPAAEEPPEDIPEDLKGTREALIAERAKRRDHKGRADRAEGELAATKAALEAATKAAAAPPAAVAPAAAAPVPAPVPRVMPNPVEDPQGFAAQLAEERFNDVLNLSESSLRRYVKDDAAVDEAVAAFKGAVAKNPSLYREMRRSPDPYQFVYDQGKSILAMAEIGTDPAAYRAKVAAEIRAELEAEQSGGTAPARPALNLPRSLAGAPSAAPRMAAVEQPLAFDQIFERRKRG